jgi:Ca2+-binding RTX toxin-like protein
MPIIEGTAGNDRLHGTGEPDWLVGGGGDDVLVGSAGGDRLDGGTGFDTADYSAGPATYGITVNLGQQPFAEGGVSTPGGSVRHSGGVDALVSIEAVRTGGGNDSVVGSNDSDRIETGAGNDRIDGGGGADMMIGGTGDDTYWLGLDGDLVVEEENAGRDHVFVGVGAYAAPANVEDLTGYASVTLTGNALDNRLTGGDFDDTLIGLAGNDELIGGRGRDTMRGGTGNDIYAVDDAGDVVEENAGEGVDEVRTALGSKSDYSQLYRLGANVENLTGFNNDGQGVYGNALDNLIFLRDGADLVVLEDGGDDRVFGNGGADFFYYGGAFTAADYTDGGAGIDTVALLGTYDLTFGPRSLTDVERLVLYSGGNGGATSYRIVLPDGNVAAGAQLAVVASSLRAGETLHFEGHAERDGRFVVYGGAGADFVIGGAKADRLFGGAGRDELHGLDGNDLLAGGPGSDFLHGGAGADIFLYASVADSPATASDRITDFGPGDRIDLSRIDAKSGTAADDAFTFIGTNSDFTGTAGELRAIQRGDNWFVEADVDGDRLADLVIGFNGTPVFAASDFML